MLTKKELLKAYEKLKNDQYLITEDDDGNLIHINNLYKNELYIFKNLIYEFISLSDRYKRLKDYYNQLFKEYEKLYVNQFRK